jgi:iron(III) transport system ATP-binding protein
MRVTVKNLTKRFGTTTVLKNISLEIADEELFFLLGPSGCGKTTLLRTIAGFYQPDDGDLMFGARSMRGVPAHLRNTGMVFQNYALWPHMTVEQNVAYGLEVRRVSGDEKKRRVMEALGVVRMTQYAERTPNQLSGGQQQRVALARALVIKPDVLLLDEPLSNLDAKLRLEMREEIRRIHSELRITTIYVTHDQKESLSLADRMAVLRDGVVEQLGGPRAVYRQPANRFVADFIGETNWLEGEVLSSAPLVVKTAFGNFASANASSLSVNAKVQVGFRPEAVRIGRSDQNCIGVSVAHVSYLGEIEQYELELAPGLRVKAFEQNPLEIRPVRQRLDVHILPQDILVLPAGNPV